MRPLALSFTFLTHYAKGTIENEGMGGQDSVNLCYCCGRTDQCFYCVSCEYFVPFLAEVVHPIGIMGRIDYRQGISRFISDIIGSGTKTFITVQLSTFVNGAKRALATLKIQFERKKGERKKENMNDNILKVIFY